MKKTRVLAGLVAAGGILAFGVAASPASATERKLPKCHACTTSTRHDATGILTTSNGEPQSETNPASSAVVVVGNGVEVTLPDATAKAGYTVATSPTLLSAIAKLEYRTWQLNPSSVALPSLNLTLDFNGPAAGGFTTLVYEPYQDGRSIHPNEWQVWDALRDGHAKWWSTRPLALLPGNGQQASPQPWEDILTKYPDAVMVAWGLNFGKGSAGAHARWGAVTIGTIDWCTTTVWTPKPKPTPSASASPSGSPSASPTPTKTVPQTTTATTTPQSPKPESPTVAPTGPGGQIGQGPGGSLALTGSDTPLWARPWSLVGIGCMAVAAGLVLVLFLGKRKRKFTA